MNETPIAPKQPKYWRSLGQLENSKEFQEIVAREFPEGITEAPDYAAQDDVSRRGFLGAIAASVALAGMASCRKPETKILPFNKRPTGFTPGVAQHYATALTRNGYGIGVLVKSSDGRPTKIEGHPSHPSSHGGSDSQLQAELLQLYDPGRSHAARNAHSMMHAEDGHGEHGGEHGEGHDDHGHGGHAHHEVNVWDEFASWLDGEGADLVNVKQGEGLHILMAPTSSPSLLAAKAKMLSGSLPKAKFHSWTPLHDDNALAGAQLAFGKPLQAHYDLAKADVVLTLDCDVLEGDGNTLAAARGWGSRRRQGQNLSRLYAVESTFTTTGTAADHRFRTKSSEIPAVAFALAKALGIGAGTDLEQALSSYSAANFEKNGKQWLEVIAQDLQSAAGKCAVVAGPTQPPAVHAIVHAINAKLGNIGKSVTLTQRPEGMQGSAVASIQELAAALQNKTVETLVFLGTNPVYDAPADLKFGDLLRDNKPKTTIHVGLYEDETAHLCDWHFPLAHELECWGDARAHDGTVSLQQPLLAPLHGGVSALEFLAFLNQDMAGNASYEDLIDGRDTTFGFELVKQHWQQATGAADFENGWWPKALHDGVVEGTAFAAETASVNTAAIAPAVQGVKPGSGIEVVIRACPKLADGRYANNSWLVEIPDPLTKLSWDNAALISMATARNLGVENGDFLTIGTGDGSQVKIPAWILPGHADESVTVYLGWGRTVSDDLKVAHGTGFDVYPLRTSSQQWVLAGASVSRGEGSHKLVCTQEHGTMAGRALVREATAAENAADPQWAPKMSPLDQAARLQGKVEKDINNSLWEERGYDKGLAAKDEQVRKSPYQWGMVMDLNACTGCQACMTACVAENNIPMVGKVQVARNREMFWIRCDRYFTSTGDDDLQMAEDPQVASMPVPCMQCENAPCESVCPVAATVHSPDGLNAMVYNRCIGTRYCSNNCPYKVRRYNYLDYLGTVPETKKMAFNPDVTVRSRGVMEKCTYCVQRINGARIEAKLSGKVVGDGDNDVHVTTACAQACPTQAITFGNIIDTNSHVAKLRGSDLNYGLLSELNTKPRTTYLGRVRNPNPALS